MVNDIYKKTSVKSMPDLTLRAEVAELVDALGSGSSGGCPVGVQISPSAP